ncbi:16S rRNA (cytidine(1402)-2'-O)-methyltransferase [Rhodospirillum sp. A1_3_36]|uniref:16S rRNA (cytidine(1402)-2'-O)-methyltransferase n=1 Tax=Rhodospirillum sp. A1_3_36 TaxID=3391666 RepID=UPI0039A73BFF
MSEPNFSTQPSDAQGGSPLAPGLYLVATPIGNMGDMTLRGIETLKCADLVACEDTRVTGGLMNRLGLSTRLFPYHEHNADKVRPALLARMAEGAAVALVSDAGMPLISDPGYKLVRACHDAGIAVTAAPGVSAVPTALALSGLPTDRFLFAGFPPSKAGKLAAFRDELAPIAATLVLFEGVSRLGKTLAVLAETMGARDAAVCRELTKLYEEVRRGKVAELAAHYAQAGSPKGEVVLVIGPPPPEAAPSEADLDALIHEALAAGDGVRALSDALSKELGLPRRTVYQRALTLSKGGED